MNIINKKLNKSHFIKVESIENAILGGFVAEEVVLMGQQEAFQ